MARITAPVIHRFSLDGVAGGRVRRRLFECEPRGPGCFRPGRGVLYPDCYWPEQRLIGEADGAVKYAEANGYVNEKEREQILRDHDFRFVRWLGKQIMGTPITGRIARALEAA